MVHVARVRNAADLAVEEHERLCDLGIPTLAVHAAKLGAMIGGPALHEGSGEHQPQGGIERVAGLGEMPPRARRESGREPSGRLAAGLREGDRRRRGQGVAERLVRHRHAGRDVDAVELGMGHGHHVAPDPSGRAGDLLLDGEGGAVDRQASPLLDHVEEAIVALVARVAGERLRRRPRALLLVGLAVARGHQPKQLFRGGGLGALCFRRGQDDGAHEEVTEEAETLVEIHHTGLVGVEGEAVIGQKRSGAGSCGLGAFSVRVRMTKSSA